MSMRDDYRLDPTGTYIVSPGKFEGQRPIVVDAYELYLNGFCDDDGEVVTVEIGGNEVSFIVDDQGFVIEV